MRDTIYFVSAIPEPLRSLLAQNQPLPPVAALKQQPGEGVNWEWTIQTFLYLKQAGLDVSLVERPVAGAICIAHFDTMKNQIWAPDSFVVGIRADRSPLHMREIEIVQSPANKGGKDVFLINHWPQPGQIPRDAARGDRIERISYFGGEGGFSPKFRSASFVNSLKHMGVELNLCFDPNKWRDYQQTDLILGVRNDLHPLLLSTKPALKLVNAWQAQCVALLGNEPAYRATGKPGEDYFEVNYPQDVLDIVARLKQNPSLYQNVRQAGIQRYREFSIQAVQQEWIDLLTGPVASAFACWQEDTSKTYSYRHVRRYWQATRQWLDHKLFYSQVRSRQIINRRFLSVSDGKRTTH